MKLDSSNRNVVVAILIGFDLLFFSVTITLYILAIHLPTLKDLADKVWTVFMASNGAVSLALSIDGKHADDGKRSDSSATDGSPANPTK
jgi:hypothetical protein